MMELRPSTRNKQSYLISFNIFCIIIKYTKINILVNNVTVNGLALLPKMSLN